MTRIPRAEILAIMERYDDSCGLDGDLTTAYVRGHADHLRAVADGDDPKAALLAEADELDALVDRYENERDNHCIAYSEDPDTRKCICGHSDDEHDRGLGQCEADLRPRILWPDGTTEEKAQ